MVDFCAQNFNQNLKEHIKLLTAGAPKKLIDAVKYNLRAGKYFRPQLLYASGLIAGIDAKKLTTIAYALELTHTYSLIHDDLPAMDNDDIRRNQPSCHKAFNEATAILVGDCLQSLAFQSIATAENLKAQEKSVAIEELTLAIGANGMVGGQYLDLQQPDSGQELIFQLKTGALFHACLVTPVKLQDNYSTNKLQRLKQCAYHLGLAYQWQDDSIDNSCSHSADKAILEYEKSKSAISELSNSADLQKCIDIMLAPTLELLQPVT